MNKESKKSNLKDLKLPNQRIKKIHLVCKDKTKIEDELWKRCINKYKKIYSNYDVKLYDYTDIYDIIRQHYPKYLDKIKYSFYCKSCLHIFIQYFNSMVLHPAMKQY